MVKSCMHLHNNGEIPLDDSVSESPTNDFGIVIDDSRRFNPAVCVM